MVVEELALDMCHAGDLAKEAGAAEVLKAGIVVGTHPYAEAGEMIVRVLILAILGEALLGRWRHRSAPRTLITGVGPEPGHPVVLPPMNASFWTGVSSANIASAEIAHRPATSADGFGSAVDLPTPVGERGAVEVEPVALENPALAVGRQVVGVFAD